MCMGVASRRLCGALYLEFTLVCSNWSSSCRHAPHACEAMSLFIGKVIGTKMQKTAKVEVTRLFLHPQVLKVRN